MKISHEKTTIMLIGPQHPRNCHFYLDSQELKISHSVRDLGLIYSDRLNFEDYIATSTRHAFAKANCILKAFATRNMDTLFQLFLSYVRPSLEYCSTVGLHTKSKISVL